MALIPLVPTLLCDCTMRTAIFGLLLALGCGGSTEDSGDGGVAGVNHAPVTCGIETCDWPDWCIYPPVGGQDTGVPDTRPPHCEALSASCVPSMDPIKAAATCCGSSGSEGQMDFSVRSLRCGGP
jgi:hypothetical protein